MRVLLLVLLLGVVALPPAVAEQSLAGVVQDSSGATIGAAAAGNPGTRRLAIDPDAASGL